MDILKTAREIGCFETGYNIIQVLDNGAISEKIGCCMPLPDGTLIDSLEYFSHWLIGIGKNKFLFLNPEIAVIERMARYAPLDTEAIIVVPVDMDNETRGRLSGNLPPNLKVSVLPEPFFPNEFYPSNGVVIASGYLANHRPMVLQETYRLIDHYCGFKGKRIFISYVTIPTLAQYDEWIEIDARKFSMVWSSDRPLSVRQSEKSAHSSLFPSSID